MIEELLARCSSIKDPEEYLRGFLQGAHTKCDTLGQMFDVSLEQMGGFYKQAYALYEKDQYKEALEIFRLLVLLDPFFKKHWLGFAACLQMLEQYEEAARAYAMLSLLDDSDPYPHYYAYQCLMKMGESEEANLALEMAKSRCEGNGVLLEKIEKIKNHATNS